jgi:hypothetical protein
MSRLIIYNLDGSSAGEIQANCNRGWAINEGGKATVTLPLADSIKPWLQFGRMVYVAHPRLPAWAGMIDTPWRAMQPVQISIYNSEYLLNLRTPDVRLQLGGRAGKIALSLLSNANKPENLRIEAGEIDMDTAALNEQQFEIQPIWEQLQAFMKKFGMEMQLRPELDASNRLVINLDVQTRLGKDTNFLLQDGKAPNMVITGAEIQGEIWNRVLGTGQQDGSNANLVSDPHIDDDSVRLYRMRGKAVSFGTVANRSALQQLTETELQASSAPVLKLTVNVFDRGDTFSNLRLGNTLIVQAAQLILPGGVRGWKGLGRITAMAYDESKNVVTLVLMGAL